MTPAIRRYTEQQRSKLAKLCGAHTIRTWLCQVGWHAKPFTDPQISKHCSNCGTRIIP